ncbi:MAG: hypothetical protein ACKOBM_09060, partial [Gammaproteobacteria bacterium]
MTERPAPDQPAARVTWRHHLEAAPLRLLWCASRILPRRLVARSAGAVFATLGPRTRKQQHVKRNLGFVQPEADSTEITRLARGVWRNFGMVLAEFPHLDAIA